MSWQAAQEVRGAPWVRYHLFLGDVTRNPSRVWTIVQVGSSIMVHDVGFLSLEGGREVLVQRRDCLTWFRSVS